MADWKRRYKLLLQRVAESHLCIYDTKLQAGRKFCPGNCERCLDEAIRKELREGGEREWAMQSSTWSTR